ncbi:hypothetical protein F4860DRAFT_488600 [Xylaria cubensis]|nr:hypothetical protein F4860DRAFT_488600 [Xylaria cubensis]
MSLQGSKASGLLLFPVCLAKRKVRESDSTFVCHPRPREHFISQRVKNCTSSRIRELATLQKAATKVLSEDIKSFYVLTAFARGQSWTLANRSGEYLYKDLMASKYGFIRC